MLSQRRGRLVVPIACLLLAFSESAAFLAGSVPGSAEHPLSSGIPTGLAVAPHGPIRIEGDASFTPSNGVVGGSGTSNDPYVISGWEINASAATGIWVNYTNASFVIRNVDVHSGGRTHHGVVLNWIGWGTWETRAGHPVVENSTFADVLSGIFAYGVSNATFQFNRISDIHEMGVELTWIENVVIAHNRVTDIPSGSSALYLESVQNVTVAGNHLGPSQGGGIIVAYAQTTRIYRNNLVSIAFSPGWNSNSGNDVQWDGGYPMGGNYWSDYSGVDRCRGSDESDCMGPDGLADSGYGRIGGYGGTDRFPWIGAFPDESVPLIQQVPITAGKAGMPIPVAVNVTSGSSLPQVQVWYGGAGGASWAAVNLSHDAGSAYRGQLPAQPRVGTLEYYVLVTDGYGTRSRNPQFGVLSFQVSEDFLSPASAPFLLAAGGAAIAAVAVLTLILRRRRLKRPPLAPPSEEGVRPPGNP